MPRSIETRAIKGKFVPHNLEAERALLGSILLDNGALNIALEQIGKDDFFSEAHRVTFERMVGISEKNRTIDLVTLSEELAKGGLIEKVGGATYLAALLDGVPAGSAASVREYCGIVKEKAALRTVIHLSEQAIQEAMQGIEPAGEIAVSVINALSSVGVVPEGLLASPISEVIRGATPSFNRAGGAGGVLYGKPTGFTQLDEKLGGWISGEFVIIGGRPSQGKTALALEFVQRQCLRGVPCLFLSLETSQASIAVRLICRRARISTHRFLTGHLTKAEWSQFTTALAEVRTWPLWVSGAPGLDVTRLRLSVEALVKRSPAGFVVVDYLQLLRAKAENRTQEVTEVSRQLKQLAVTIGQICGGTLIAVSQLSRIDADEQPRLHHLRESGQLEQDADTVLFIYNGEQAETGQDRPFKKILEIAKQRNGPTGLLPLTFFPQSIGFEECAVAAESEESS